MTYSMPEPRGSHHSVAPHQAQRRTLASILMFRPANDAPCTALPPMREGAAPLAGPVQTSGPVRVEARTAPAVRDRTSGPVRVEARTAPAVRDRGEGEVAGAGPSRPVLEALFACRGALRAAAGPGVAVHLSAESRLPPLALDDDSLERVLLQLVKNASEAMPQGGAVHIVARRALSRSTPAVLVHVSDDGEGIPALALEHIFKPGFSSRRNTRGWGEGCGLGLTIVHELLQSVGGSIEVASRRRRGTTFELRIPCKSLL